MRCKCKRCGTETSMFWYPFTYGYPAGNHEIKEDDVFYLCDRCVYEFELFLDVDLYMLKERIQ